MQLASKQIIIRPFHAAFVGGLVIFMLIILVGAKAFAGAVICNSALDLAEGDIKDVFSGEKQSAGSTKLTVVDNKAAEDDFLQKNLSLAKAKYDAQWAKKAFREGISAPASLGNDAEVISFVKSNPGGVGYVSADPGGGVKVIKKY